MSSYCDEYGVWRLDNISDFLPGHLLNNVLSMVPLSVSNINDVIAWSKTTNETFSMKAAYTNSSL